LRDGCPNLGLLSHNCTDWVWHLINREDNPISKCGQVIRWFCGVRSGESETFMNYGMRKEASRVRKYGYLKKVLLFLFLLVSAWGTPGLMSEAHAQGGTSRTDIEFAHASTGFQLTGGHAQVPCERCHVQGVFRGTPTQCMQCHSPGGRVISSFKPANHLPTTVNCNSCHRTTSWKPAFFTHNGIAPGSCAGEARNARSNNHVLRKLPSDGCVDQRNLQASRRCPRHVHVLPQRDSGSR
jgi:hypothetical protein